MKHRLKVCVAALNWGLGHASRCVPIIEAFIHSGCEVVVASDGPALVFLQKEFPHLKSLALPSYEIHYSTSIPLGLSIALQLPKILLTIKKERTFLTGVQKSEQFDVVVTDCRFGCFIPGIYSIYVTHQILIKFPSRLAFLEKYGALFHRLVWNKFTAVWVIDRCGEQSLSGKMGHSYEHHKIKYIGIASRFKTTHSYGKTIDICFLLSGPEPHRTLLENMIVDYQWPSNKKYALIRGRPDLHESIALPNNWVSANHLNSKELQNVLVSSKQIVCRSGYSTIMDLVRLGLSAFLIPTPGQPEQEYLAEYLEKKMGFRFAHHHSLCFDILLKEQQIIQYTPYHEREDKLMLMSAIVESLEGLNGKQNLKRDTPSHD